MNHPDPSLLDLLKILVNKSPGSEGFADLKNAIRLKLSYMQSPRVVEIEVLLTAHRFLSIDAADKRLSGLIPSAVVRERVMRDLNEAIGYDPNSLPH